MHKIIFMSLCLAQSISALGQTDPIVEKQARNAALERVSPVMDRQVNYVPSEFEKASQNMAELQSLLSGLNKVLEDLEQLQGSYAQAKLVLKPDATPHETLISLLDAQPSSTIKKIPLAAEPQIPLAASTISVPAQLKKKESVKPAKPAQIEPIAVRTYDNGSRPAKVILKVGDNNPAVYFVGDQISLNQDTFRLTGVQKVGVSNERHKRPIYEIMLLSDSGKHKSIVWE